MRLAGGRCASAAAQRNGSFSSRRCPLTHHFEALRRAAAGARDRARGLIDDARLARAARRAARRRPFPAARRAGSRARASAAPRRSRGCRDRDRCRSAPPPAGARESRRAKRRDRLVAAARVQRDHRRRRRRRSTRAGPRRDGRARAASAPSARRYCGCRAACAAAAGVTSAIFTSEAFRLNCRSSERYQRKRFARIMPALQSSVYPDTGTLVQMARSRRASARWRSRRISPGEQLLGPRLAIVNPPLWEIGHLGWFQERWCLRYRADGALARVACSPAPTRCTIRRRCRTTRAGTCRCRISTPRSRYLRAGARRGCSSASTREETDGAPALFRAARRVPRGNALRSLHLYAPDAGLPGARTGAAARPCPDAGPCPGDVEIPGGDFMLGATPARARLRVRQREMGASGASWRRFASRAPPSRTPSSRPSSTTAATRGASCGATPGWRWRERGRRERAPCTGASEDGRWLERRYDRWAPLASARRGHARQLVRGRRVLPLGRTAAADRGGVGGRGGSGARRAGREEHLSLGRSAGRARNAPICTARSGDTADVAAFRGR